MAQPPLDQNQGPTQPEGTNPSQPEGTPPPPQQQPEVAPDASEPATEKSPKSWKRVLAGLAGVAIFLVIGLIGPVMGLMSAKSDLQPGKCIGLKGEGSDVSHYSVECNESHEAAFMVVSNPEADECGEARLYYETGVKAFRVVKLGTVKACLAPLMREGSCYVEKGRNLELTACAPGKIKAVKVAKTADESVCPKGSVPFGYPELPLMYCIAQAK